MDDKTKAAQSKRSLKHWATMHEEILLLEARMDSIQERIDALGGRPAFEGGSRAVCYKPSGKLSYFIAEKADLEAGIARRREEADKERSRVNGILDALEDPAERFLLVSRYFDNMNWNEITSHLFNMPVGYNSEFENARRTIMNKHYLALVHFWNLEHNT